MKKLFQFSTLLFAAALLLSLAACGSEAPAPEPEEPAASEEVRETVALPAPFYLTFAPGETAEQDIDGDGQPDAVCVQMEETGDFGAAVHLFINGEDLSQTLTGDQGLFACPDDQCWLLTDLNIWDNSLEIAIQDWGPSDDLTTSFYRCKDGALRYLGSIEGFICRDGAPADATLDGQGGVQSYIRLDVLQTWWGKADSQLDRDDNLVLVPQAVYVSTAEPPQQATLNRELCAYTAAEEGSQPSVLPAGTVLELLGTDNVEWVLVRLAGEEGEFWLHLDPDQPFQVEGPDGFLESWDALDGLCMAD